MQQVVMGNPETRSATKPAWWLSSIKPVGGHRLDNHQHLKHIDLHLVVHVLTIIARPTRITGHFNGNTTVLFMITFNLKIKDTGWGGTGTLKFLNKDIVIWTKQIWFYFMSNVCLLISVGTPPPQLKKFLSGYYPHYKSNCDIFLVHIILIFSKGFSLHVKKRILYNPK